MRPSIHTATSRLPASKETKRQLYRTLVRYSCAMATAGVKRAFKYRFYPTPEQAAELSRTFGCIRLVWNKALNERQRRYSDEQQSTNYAQASASLTAWKRTPELAFLNDVSAVPLQQTLRHQQKAFSNFFAKRAGFPKFKSRKKSRASAEYTRSSFRWRDGQLTLAKMSEPLDIRWSRTLPGEPTTVTISRDPAGRWFVSILTVDTVTALPQVDAAVGVDVGLTTIAALSTGEKIVNPRHERADRRKLAKTHRALSRKQKGSNNQDKARLKLARIHGRIADRRADHLHKLSTRLIRENQAIAIEDLAVRTMVKNRRLARAISDAGWRQLRTMLEYKARWYGRDLMVVDRWYPSTRACSDCGAVGDRLPLDVRVWTCQCGSFHDRDVNAARNLLAAGLAER